MFMISKTEYEALRTAQNFDAFQAATKPIRIKRAIATGVTTASIFIAAGIGLMGVTGVSKAVLVSMNLFSVQSEISKEMQLEALVDRVRTAIALKYGADAETPIDLAALKPLLRGEQWSPAGQLITPYGGEIRTGGTAGAPQFEITELPARACSVFVSMPGACHEGGVMAVHVDDGTGTGTVM